MKGIILGIVSGLIPGLHPNLFGSFLEIQSIILMLVFYRFFSYLREIFFMIPSDSNVLSLHPIYKLYKFGKGMKALLLANTGVLISFLISIILSPLLIYFIPKVYGLSYAIGIPFLILSLGFIIMTERNKIGALLIIILSGIVGLFSLKIDNGIIPLLSGLFSFPILISKVGKQRRQRMIKKIKIRPKNVLIGLLSSLILIVTPAIGPTQSSIFAKSFLGGEDFIFTMGIIEGFDIIFSIILILTIGRARIGALQEMKTKIINPSKIPFFLSITLIAGIIAYVLTIEIGRIIIKRNFNVDKIKYPVIVLISAISFILCGFYGLIIFFISGMIGVLANKLKVRMVNCMGSLAIPTLTYKIF